MVAVFVVVVVVVVVYSTVSDSPYECFLWK